MGDNNTYEVVIGLEVHAQLLTQSKLFCGDSLVFGAEPNTQVSPLTLAHPGTLPKLNAKAVELAIRMGLACQCTIEKKNYFARKNYFYPDLPKGYQISQHSIPICSGGQIEIRTGDSIKSIRLNRIHLEEDAGKSIHDLDPSNTCVDYNRAGTPLIEIVSEPDLRSGEEAFNYLTEIRKLVRYLEVCDGNMEEGSLRCDANISVRRKGETALGTKVEIKNLNSIRNVRRAIEHEAERLTGILSRGEKVIQQTRGFDAASGTSFATREKEDAHDYRYFADPDLPPLNLAEDFIRQVRESIPALQRERIEKYTGIYKLSEYDAAVLTEEREVSDYYDHLIIALGGQSSANHKMLKAAANWMLGPVKSWINENGKSISEFPLTLNNLANLILLVEAGKVSFTIASTKLFSYLLNHPRENPEEAAHSLELLQQSGSDFLEPIVDQVLQKFPAKVVEYRKGKKGLLAMFVGEVMKQSKGKADPKVTNEIILRKLNAEN